MKFCLGNPPTRAMLARRLQRTVQTEISFGVLAIMGPVVEEIDRRFDEVGGAIRDEVLSARVGRDDS